MDQISSTAFRYAFSPALEQVRRATMGRLGSYEDRENTKGMPPDGKTPFLNAFEAMDGASYEEALAEGIVRSWLESKPVLYDNEWIVGVPRAQRPLVEHFSWGLQYRPEVLAHTAYSARGGDIQARIERLWDRLFPLDWNHIHDEGRRLMGEDVYDILGDGNLWRVGDFQGHMVPNYPKLLRLGIGGAIQEIKEAAARTQEIKKTALYRGLVILLEGFSEYILQYAAAAQARAIREEDSEKRERLLKIHANCVAITLGRPKTLYEAAQLTWFYALWDWVDCLGRMDAYLSPFYLASAATDDTCERGDIISALMLKMLEHGVHNITLGGVAPESGEDSTNELSFLILQIVRTLHHTHPRLSLRIHEKSPPEFMALAVQMWSEGMSDPTLASDATIIPGLIAYGVLPRDARDYSVLGCQEIEIPGKSNFGCEDGKLNLAKIFELAINDGRCRFTGKQIGVHTGYIKDFTSIRQVWDGYEKQMEYILPIFIRLCNRGVEIRAAKRAKLVKTAFIDDCVARGLDPDEGGAVYNFGVIETVGSSAVADSFAALDHLVYTEGRLSTKQLQVAIDANFEGHESVRRILLDKAPKFGNDEPLADDWNRRVLGHFWSKLKHHKSIRGDVFMGACSLLMGGVVYGTKTWAMPDGRFAGEPLGSSIGPRPGADKKGLTAMLRSVAKLPLRMGVGGATTNVALPTEVLKTESLRKKVATVMTAYLLNGGQMAQVTTASRDDMRDAQIHPERHGNLIVRVGGFSIHFVELEEEIQNEIISR